MTHAPIECPASSTAAAPTWSSTATRSATWIAIPYGPGNVALRPRPRRSGARRHTRSPSSRATVRHVISEAVTPCAASTTYSAASGGDPAHADVKRTAGDGNVEASGERIGCA